MSFGNSIHASKYVRTRGYFSKPKGVCEHNKFGKMCFRWQCTNCTWEKYVFVCVCVCLFVCVREIWPEIPVGEHAGEAQTVNLQNSAGASLTLTLHLARVLEIQICHHNTTVDTNTVLAHRYATITSHCGHKHSVSPQICHHNTTVDTNIQC